MLEVTTGMIITIKIILIMLNLASIIVIAAIARRVFLVEKQTGKKYTVMRIILLAALANVISYAIMLAVAVSF